MNWLPSIILIITSDARRESLEEINVFQQFLSNGFLAIIPVLIWNGVFSSKLPAAFRSDSFERDVSHFILIGESICRYAVFLMPLVLRLKIFTPKGFVV